MKFPDGPARATRRPVLRLGHTLPRVIRDATVADLALLEELRYGGTALHADRLRDAGGRDTRYLVVEWDEEVVGFGSLVLRAPPTWPPLRYVPQMLDLFVRSDLRSRGAGTELIRFMESAARADGHRELHVAVDPTANPRAHALYRRLGYTDLDPEPILERWAFTDSAGVTHRGVERLVYMRRSLATSRDGPPLG